MYVLEVQTREISWKQEQELKSQHSLKVKRKIGIDLESCLSL